MATYHMRHRSKHHTKAKGDAMAIQVHRPDDNPTSGKVLTPPPDSISRPKASVDGYGQANSTVPASIEPGKRLNSPLANNLESTVDDPALNQVRSRSLRQDATLDANQLRKLGDKNVATHSGTKGASSGSVIPGGPAREGDPLGLKRAMFGE